MSSMPAVKGHDAILTRPSFTTNFGQLEICKGTNRQLHCRSTFCPETLSMQVLERLALLSNLAYDKLRAFVPDSVD